MTPNSAVDSTAVELEHQPVPADQSVSGAPQTAALALDEFDGLEIGVWEMTPGVMSDVEADEVFVVVAGSGSVEFADGSPTLHLGPGTVCRLKAGTSTVWTVTETLRKVYLTGPA
ncbi:cupin domain-containing protein [Mycolicibacterium goodii]|nr:cupin domain-containing protein [Mycolicibacterium goodii]OKH64289.1 cupin [Mycobacterium sp. SWH-M5]ULN48980.1 cupin domain-containing protein [Mycolicibacterium goodii]